MLSAPLGGSLWRVFVEYIQCGVDLCEKPLCFVPLVRAELILKALQQQLLLRK